MTYSVRQLLADGLRRARHIIGKAGVRIDIFVEEALSYCGIWHVEAHASRGVGTFMFEMLSTFLVFLVITASTTNRVAAACRSDCRFSDASLTKATLDAATFPHAGAALFADATLQAGNKSRSRQTLNKLVEPANTDLLHATIRSQNMDAGFATGVSPLHTPARPSSPERFGPALAVSLQPSCLQISM